MTPLHRAHFLLILACVKYAVIITALFLFTPADSGDGQTFKWTFTIGAVLVIGLLYSYVRKLEKIEKQDEQKRQKRNSRRKKHVK